MHLVAGDRNESVVERVLRACDCDAEYATGIVGHLPGPLDHAWCSRRRRGVVRRAPSCASCDGGWRLPRCHWLMA